MSLSTQIIIGMLLGILTGVFFGELTAPLNVIAETFIRLMQMTVIPYITVALILGFGKIRLSDAKLLGRRGGLLLLLFWLVAIVAIALTPLTFPSLTAATFFSTTDVTARAEFDLVQLYIPSNPFHSLANSIVPAVVLFSTAVGIALIGIEKKETFLRPGDFF